MHSRKRGPRRLARILAEPSVVAVKVFTAAPVGCHLPKPVLMTPDNIQYLPGEGMPVGLTPEASYGLEETALPETFMLVLMSDGVLETIDEVDLIEREKALLSRLGGTLEKPGDLIRRLDLGEVTSDDLADDIAGLFVSRGVG